METTDLPWGEPVRPSRGVVVARRTFFGTAAAALAAAGLPGARANWRARQEPGD